MIGCNIVCYHGDERVLKKEVGLHMVEFLCVHLNFAQTRAFVIVFVAVECLRYYSNV